jgi:hypothetical protein
MSSVQVNTDSGEAANTSYGIIGDKPTDVQKFKKKTDSIGLYVKKVVSDDWVSTLDISQSNLKYEDFKNFLQKDNFNCTDNQVDLIITSLWQGSTYGGILKNDKVGYSNVRNTSDILIDFSENNNINLTFKSCIKNDKKHMDTISKNEENRTELFRVNDEHNLYKKTQINLGISGDDNAQCKTTITIAGKGDDNVKFIKDLKSSLKNYSQYGLSIKKILKYFMMLRLIFNNQLKNILSSS